MTTDREAVAAALAEFNGDDTWKDEHREYRLCEADAAIACLRDRWTGEAAVARAARSLIKTAVSSVYRDKAQAALTAAMRDTE